jgi:hypothetical protein
MKSLTRNAKMSIRETIGSIHHIQSLSRKSFEVLFDKISILKKIISQAKKQIFVSDQECFNLISSLRQVLPGQTLLDEGGLELGVKL